ncbi:amino acid permease [Nocardia sp. NEAU-G5]|uniref:Amino acid permease n=1 Tax=Nocardia albiluteola TaxID=2842303 RepID=A0ABS6AZF1_9NOCA|nr:amino acid permease [Nocardia albiluteola]MBU3063427.1 amino acid permease [Nocardia albiluteola]
MSISPQNSGKLRPGINTRQLTMIGIGGVIGAGLFVGSGKTISSAGPGIVLVYLLTGIVVILVMRMLAELATANPETGSFSSHASRELGTWAGLSVGWVYAYHWCITVAFESIAGAAIARQLLPGPPTWFYALLFMSALTAVNLAAVSSFARFEFWFALIKVTAIVVFIGIGIAAIAGLFPDRPAPGTTNLLGRGGLFPKGYTVLLTAALTVFFSYFGTELVTIAAGEAKDPAREIRTSMRSVAGRILLFYVGSVFVIVTLLPWNSAQVTESPYAAVLNLLGIPGAKTIMNLIVLTAVLSCLNSGLYASSRMLYSLAQRGEGPRLLRRTNRAGVPVAGVLAASSAGFLAVVANYFLPTGTVFNFLLSSSGSIAVVVYLCICATQIRSRRCRTPEQIATLTVRMWGAPYLSYAVGLVLVVVIAGMAFTGSTRRPLVLTLTVTGIAVVAGVVQQRRRSPKMLAVTAEAPRDD